jgi:hypothetical protein
MESEATYLFTTGSPMTLDAALAEIKTEETVV